MRLLAIGNISDGKETIGFRLLDVDSEQTKDVPSNNVKGVLSSGNVQIDNLMVKDGLVVGSNGSIDRLPKLINGQLVGKSPMVIINQIGDIGYEVCDFKGTILNVRNTDIIKYASLNGISNGKIVDKDGNEFISAINGKYTMKKMEDAKRRGPYTGDIVTDMKSLSTIVAASESSYVYSDNHTIVSHYNGMSLVNRGVKLPNIVDMNNIQRGLMYESNGHLLLKCVIKSLNMRDNKDEIRKLLAIKEFRDSIDDSISNRGKYGGKIDKDTGIEVPTSDRERYMPVHITQSIDVIDRQYEDVNKETIELYAKYLKVMKVRVFVRYTIQSKNKVALIRKCSKEGIAYEIIDLSKNGREMLSIVNLEDIYNYSSEYNNVIVSGKEIKIIGFNGVYSYDMDLIHKTYNRAVIKSTKTLKAMVLGSKYHEGVNEIGELKKLVSDGEVLKIPDNVKVIQEDSIILSKENTKILFGDNIEECSSKAFKNDYNRSDWASIEYIEIDGKKATTNILTSLANVTHQLSKDLVIHFNRDVTVAEYVKIIYEIQPAKDITSSNPNSINDSFILDVINKIIVSQLGKLMLIKKPIAVRVMKDRAGKKDRVMPSPTLWKFTERFRVLEYAWTAKIEKHASIETQYKINKIIREIREQLDFREREMHETMNKMTSNGDYSSYY